MILDSELIFSGTVSSGTWTGQAITASGDTASTSYVDTKAAGDAMNPGARIKIVATELFAGTGTTIRARLQTDSDSGFATALVSLLDTGTIAKASTVAGTVLLDAVIPNGVKRYLRVLYTSDNTFETTGKVFAAIVLDTDRTLDRSL